MKREMRFKNWYPSSLEEISEFIPAVKRQEDAIGMLVPHAGWTYSGKTAAEVYASARQCDTYVLFCPSHTGLGEEISVYPSGVWETPIGGAEVDEELAKSVIRKSKYAKADFTAHIMEHSAEVELPFIKALNPSAKILPIVIMTQNYEKCFDIASSVYEAVKESGKKAVIAASSDMSHYSDSVISKICDDMAIYQILSLDAKNFLKTVEEKNISICGAGACAAMIIYSNLAGAKNARLLKYSNSGEISGDFSEVVGYAGIITY